MGLLQPGSPIARATCLIWTSYSCQSLQLEHVLNSVCYEHDGGESLDLVRTIDALVPTRSKVSRRGQVGVNHTTPLFTIGGLRKANIDLERMSVKGSVDVGAATSLDGEGEESRFVVVPVVFMPDDIR